MKKARKQKRDNQQPSTGVEAAVILGDLTELNQITRVGNVVTLHGKNSRTFTLPDRETASNFWTRLFEEAEEAVSEDRQFFCVAFGDTGGSDPYEGAAGGTVH
jgi:hypothetical protein